ncbi:TonB-dependent receptor [Hyphococcus luteus]|uniref:TonB-dependent receptor n=1 Tax=Hyphococcus luteus TaxID=2058213 RepID=A0A2S7K0C8_9PROT|nr:TonB-dependent receptor [Marinicaulis flavus]PQA85926.1 TonB-dependent receptor [Marinicaulis flavus]
MKLKLTTSIGAMAIALSSVAYAQVDTITVTAQKREENVQDVPIAVSAFDGDALQERAVTSVAGLSNITPNVSLDAGTPFSGDTAVISAYIRGIGANDFAFNIDPGVGVYLDGVYLARSIGANQDLLDVERIEVLKGPQGTLFGRNTIGGAISIVTHEPGDEFSFSGDVTTGSFELLQIRATADIPLSDSLKSSISVSMKDRRGYLKRIPYPGFENYNVEPIQTMRAAIYGNQGDYEGGTDAKNARIKLVYEDGGPFKATLSGDYAFSKQSQLANKLVATSDAVFAGSYNCAIEGIQPPAGDMSCGGGPPPIAYAGGIGGLTWVADNPPIFGVNTDADPYNDRLPYDDRFITDDIDTSYANGNNVARLENYGVHLTLDYDLGANAALKSISAYRHLDWDVGMDLDNSPLNFLHTSFTTDQWQFSQEVQLTGSALDERINYVFGGYYFVEEGDLHDFVTFAEGLLQVDGPNYLKTTNYAGFGQIDFKVTDWLTVTAGGRYTHEKKLFEGAQSDRNGLNYKIAQQFGDPDCMSLAPTISEACRIAQGFPVPGEPLRYYIEGIQTKKFNNFSPKVSVQVFPTDGVMLYGSYSEGYRTGGWTTRLSNPLDYAPDFDEENATSWEGGLKSTLFDNSLLFNVAAFTTKYEGIQLNFQQGVSPTIQNAGTARIKGLEVETVYAPGGGLSINASVGLINAEYIDVLGPAQVAPNPLQAGVIPGADLPKTPDFKFNVSPRYEFNMGNGAIVTLLADYTHTASMWNDTERTFLLQRPSTDILNLSASYEEPGGRWNITVGGTNLTDERYLTTGQAQIAGGQIYGTYSRPAEWYARLGVNF